VPILTADDKSSPIIFKRRQFPVRPAFAMTTNEAQGQTLENVELYLPTPVFTHGQLYAALSRCTDEKNLKVLMIDGSIPGLECTYTRNVVYKRVL
jgi:ATP-dependent exoDNAse (exonuclease V) alpha subunit